MEGAQAQVWSLVFEPLWNSLFVALHVVVAVVVLCLAVRWPCIARMFPCIARAYNGATWMDGRSTLLYLGLTSH